jgi:hypothetical protein
VVEQNRFGTIVPGPDEEPASSSAQPPPLQPASPQPGYAHSTPSYPPPNYAPPTQSADPTYPPPSYPPVGYPPPAVPMFGGPPARRSARTGRIVGISAAILVALVVGVAIAVPVFQEQQAKAAAARTTFTMPMAIAGMNRISGAADSMVQSEVADLPAGIGTPLGAAYGAGTVSVIVLGGVHAMTSKGQRDFFTGFRRSVQAQGYQLASVSPGVLGGRMECGSTADGTRTICGFTDSGALGAVVVGGSGDAAHQMALVVRSAVERRS